MHYAHYLKQPRFFWSITSDGTGGNAAMVFKVTAGYQGAFAII